MSDTFCHVKNRPCYRDDCEPGKFCAMYDKPVTNIAADPIAAEARAVQDAIDAFCVEYVQHISATNPGHVIPREQVLRGMLARVFERMKSAGRDEASAWRRVDVDPPPNDDTIFLTYGEGRTFLAKGSIFWSARQPRTPAHLSMAYITHWMPLPTPPEGGER